MHRPLPNLDWLRVFASTAATESFAVAAGQLGVSPGAVSQRIKALEAFLGIALFQRYAQGVRLTEAGRRYAARVLPPLEQLTLATRELTSGDAAKSVRLTILPALAQLWLGPRMGRFHQAHSSATIEIWADPAIVDLRTSSFDVAIRYGKPPFPGYDHRALLFDELVLVAAPALVASSLRNAQGMPTDAPLMLDNYWPTDFDDWLRHTGRSYPTNCIVQTFSLYSMAVEATLNGRGFMIGHTALVGDLITQGRLELLSQDRAASDNQFYLLTRIASPLSETAEAFVAWVFEQARDS